MLVVAIIAVLLAIYLSKIVAWGIVKIAHKIAVRADNETSDEKKIQLRRIETYLSVTIALARVVVVSVVVYIAWLLLEPHGTSGVFALGASAIVIVTLGATVGSLLRDIMNGITMIVEQWFNVGEFIRVEPFADVSGVVERLTLRSTKIRSLNGEVVWLHNQHIQGVHVTRSGLRTIAVDIFANDEKIGRDLIEKAINTLPQGTLKMVERPEITRHERWGDTLWYFTVVGNMMPGREWLMERYFIDSLTELDEHRDGPKLFVRPPIARYADADAEKSFRRAVSLGSRAAKKTPRS